MTCRCNSVVERDKLHTIFECPLWSFFLLALTVGFGSKLTVNETPKLANSNGRLLETLYIY